MRLLRGTPHVPGPQSEEPTVDMSPPRCEACRREGIPLVGAVLGDGTRTQLCADVVSCRHHWSAKEAT